MVAKVANVVEVSVAWNFAPQIRVVQQKLAVIGWLTATGLPRWGTFNHTIINTSNFFDTLSILFNHVQTFISFL